MDGAPRKTSPWVLVLLGCGGLLLLSCLGVGAFVYFIARKADSYAKDMSDPAKREAEVKKVLGAKGNLPVGYHAAVTLSVPFVMNMAILSDKPMGTKGEAGQFDRRGYIFVKLLLSQDQSELRDYFQGKTDDPAVLQRNKINVRPKEIINRGTFPLDGREVLYLSQRADVQPSGQSGRVQQGISTLILFQCPDAKARTGIWFGEDPSPDKPAKEIELAGTVGDPAAIRAFVGHFDPCSS